MRNIILLGVAGILAGGAAWSQSELWHEASPFLWERAMILYLLAFSVAVTALTARREVRGLWQTALRHRRELAILSLLTVAALGLRVGALDRFPPAGMLGPDEQLSGAMAHTILKGARPQDLNPITYYYPVALAFSVFGETVLVMRITHIVVGVLTIPAFWLMLRAFSPAYAALAVTGLLVASRWHNFISRTAIDWVYVPLLMALTAGLMIWGLKKGRPVSFLLAGAALGIGIYGYAPFRVIPPAIALFLVAYFLRYRGELRRQWMNVALMFAAFGLVSAPYWHIVSHDPRQFTERHASVQAISRPEILSQHGGTVLGVIGDNAVATWRLLAGPYGEPWGIVTPPGGSMFMWVELLLVAAALVARRRQWLKPPTLLFVLLALAAIIGGGVLTETLRGTRVLTVAGPAVYALIAFGAPGTAPRFNKYRYALPILWAAMLLVAGGLHIGSFFGAQITDRTTRAEYYHAKPFMARVLADSGAAKNYVVGSFDWHDYTWLIGEGRQAKTLAEADFVVVEPPFQESQMRVTLAGMGFSQIELVAPPDGAHGYSLLVARRAKQ